MKWNYEMCALDFKEIPVANKNSGRQDAFELFAEEFFQIKGFQILEAPGRGADGGKDLIIECLNNIGSIVAGRYLVSCKHNAHSGKSVSPGDEINILERVRSKRCDGFIAFYSTLASTSLQSLIEGLKDDIQIEIFHWAKIEKEILDDDECHNLVKRYFPESYKKWTKTVDLPLKLVRRGLDKLRFPSDSPYFFDLHTQGNGYWIQPRLRPGVDNAESLKISALFPNKEAKALLARQELRPFTGKLNKDKTSNELWPFFDGKGSLKIISLESYAEAVIHAGNDDGEEQEIRDQLIHIDSDPNSGSFALKVVTPNSPIDLELRLNSEPDSCMLWTIALSTNRRGTSSVLKGVNFMECLSNSGRITIRIAQEHKVRVEGRKHIREYVPGQETILTSDVVPLSIDLDMIEQYRSCIKNLRLIEDRLKLCLILNEFPGNDMELLATSAQSLASLLREAKLVHKDNIMGQTPLRLDEVREMVKGEDRVVCFRLDSFILPRTISFMGLQLCFNDIKLKADKVQLVDGEKERLEELLQTSPSLECYDVNWQSIPECPITTIFSTPVVENLFGIGSDPTRN